jgi:hypothetical protein
LRAPSAAVSITFDRALQTSSVTAASLPAYRGTASGPIAFSNDKTITLTPSTPFAVGEVVLVNLSHDLAADASPMRSAGYAYQFRIQTQPAALVFSQIDVMSNRTNPSTQTRIYGAMAADLDHDGYADLTTVNEVSADLRVFMNKADGTGTFHTFLTPPLPIGRVEPERAGRLQQRRQDGHLRQLPAPPAWRIALGSDGTYGTAQEVAVGSSPRDCRARTSTATAISTSSTPTTPATNRR